MLNQSNEFSGREGGENLRARVCRAAVTVDPTIGLPPYPRCLVCALYSERVSTLSVLLGCLLVVVNLLPRF